MSRKPHISPELCQRVAERLFERNATRSKVAKEFGISITTVHRIGRSASAPCTKRGRQRSEKWRYCEHPRTPENTSQSGGRWGTCKTCKQRRDRERYQTGVSTGHGYRPIPRHVLNQILPRPLPIRDTSCRSYSLAPQREKQSA